MLRSSLLLLSVLLLLFPLSSLSWSAPWFCHDLDCPIFENLNTTNEWETRKYEGGTFARVEIEGRSLALAEMKGYKRLYEYFHGKNAMNTRIERTTPVITAVKPGLAKNKYFVHFFLPFSSQDNYPTPNDASIQIVNYAKPSSSSSSSSSSDSDGHSEFIVAVRSFGGYGVDVMDQLQSLQEQLDRNGIEYNPHIWFFAGYDNPKRMKDRHNEVWLKLKGDGEGKLRQWGKMDEMKNIVKGLAEEVDESIASPLANALKAGREYIQHHV